MPQLVSCPHCQRQLNVPDNLLGKNVKCPSCQNTFTATAEGAGGGAESAAETPRRSAGGEGAGGGSGGMRGHRGILILCMGIASLLLGCCGPLVYVTWILGAVTIWLGGGDLKAMDRGEMDPAGRGQTKIGWILGIAGVVWSVLLICGSCGYGIFSMVLGGKS
jgi:predicted Zn finger-like uncharacterized protein